MEGKSRAHYKTLAKAIGLHFIIMYFLSYLLVDRLSHAYLISSRPFYMALAMVSPMVFLMVYFMQDMLTDARLNRRLMAGSAALFVLAVLGARSQFLVGDELFLKSMIPHHSGAITTCEQANITDPEIRELCSEIVKTQKEEIAKMQSILEESNRAE